MSRLLLLLQYVFPHTYGYSEPCSTSSLSPDPHHITLLPDCQSRGETHKEIFKYYRHATLWTLRSPRRGLSREKLPHPSSCSRCQAFLSDSLKGLQHVTADQRHVCFGLRLQKKSVHLCTHAPGVTGVLLGKFCHCRS